MTRKLNSRESEAILIALDQISQTIEVMTSVVGRLKTYLHSRENDDCDDAGADPKPDANRRKRGMEGPQWARTNHPRTLH